MLSFEQLRVLIALSNDQIGTALRDFFKKSNAATAVHINHSSAAKAQLEGDVFNLLIVSDHFDSIGGLDFIRMVRASGFRTSYAAIIYALAAPSREAILTARNAGIDRILVAPFSMAVFEKALSEVLSEDRCFVQSTGYTGPCRRRNQCGVPDNGERRQQAVGVIPARKLQHVRAGGARV